ncbi:hypothetical protein TWF694_002180 [Orbilia ellipsospora]|uniref:Uncharacterized protein n=1 Tax=Orbilia ellipsospora TaxID=2528407 RepID=A0AAV9X7D7_9PEZI
MVDFRRFVYSLIPERRKSEESFDCESSLLPEKEEHHDKSISRLNNFPRDGTEIEDSRDSYLHFFIRFFHITLTLFFAFTTAMLYINIKTTNVLNPQITYSPATSAIKYTTRLFDSGLNYGKTIYQGPPAKKNNDAWTALFIHGLTRISAAEAAPMQNKTLPIPDDPENYITSLAVFHQLHCLNAIRMALWNATLIRGEEDETNMRHLDHCVDMIRQAIMCHSDISPFVWGRDPRDGKAKGISSVTHTCRDFEAIQKWAQDRPFKTGFNTSKVITGDPLGWADYHYVLDYGEITDWEKQEPDYKNWAEGKKQEMLKSGQIFYDGDNI